LQDEAQVLYWKCRRYDHEQIAQKMGWSTAWVQLRMVRIYKKLGFKKEMHWTKRARLLRREVCPIFNDLIKNDLRNIPKVFAPELEFIEDIEVIEEENQAKSVVKVHQVEESPADVLTEEDNLILDLVLYDEMKEEEEKEEEDQRRREEPINIGPQPLLNSGRTGSIRPIWITLGLFLICAGIVGVAWMQRGRLFAGVASSATSTQDVQVSESPEGPTATGDPSSTPSPTDTQTNTPEPTLTYTPEVAVPLPIIEHFNKPMSNFWQITGDPILTTSDLYSYDGVLTTLDQHFASVQIGNKAWADYIIHFKANSGAGEIILGFRVQDLNNMLGIQCVAYNCEWVVINNGVKESISRASDISFQNEFTLTVEGDNYNGVTNWGSGFEEDHPFLVLPPKYQGKFLTGGIYIRFKDTQIDYIEILSVR
jgi:hypothetical protein